MPDQLTDAQLDALLDTTRTDLLRHLQATSDTGTLLSAFLAADPETPAVQSDEPATRHASGHLHQGPRPRARQHPRPRPRPPQRSRRRPRPRPGARLHFPQRPRPRPRPRSPPPPRPGRAGRRRRPPCPRCGSSRSRWRVKAPGVLQRADEQGRVRETEGVARQDLVPGPPTIGHHDRESAPCKARLSLLGGSGS
jgi:hypothetical protein